MGKELLLQRNADPWGERVVEIYRVTGLMGALRWAYQPLIRTVLVPSGVGLNPYELVKKELLADQIYIARQNGEVVIRG